ncbi:amino acid ABC transporter substrate-binding protein [Bosea sp. PAMC 26642]|uniref:amino acid ABC transporter substrate-binding protein n=1 Tax=Bosea sp. (strain PAMC 26642) TaxID=1792307 RepID=UPI00076FFFC9|nr:amino acid ABC transporter substrate-binding protein [Bosea sp. PAMC 26642]AMJ61580.1 amino acid ABC transporter substrate-binding protein [Bosea sp. PAMC 26642]
MAISKTLLRFIAKSSLRLLFCLAGSVAVTSSFAQSASVLDGVKSRGAIRCGIHVGLAGFAFVDKSGAWQGLDVDLCKAVAAAVLGKSDKVQFLPLNAKDRFIALQSGEIDLLSRNTTWTLDRNTRTGLNFTGVNFHDGQGFMVKATSGIKVATELNGATICVVQGTSTEKGLADFFASRKLKYEPVAYSETDAVRDAYVAGRCDAVTSDRSQLAAIRSVLTDAKAHVILPDVISKEPLGPSVKNGDQQWANIVRWSLNAMIEAEELGLSSREIRARTAGSADPVIQRFAGKLDNLGEALGLDNDWAVRIIEQVGNYAESYDRNIAPIGLDRGVNRLWRDGGLLISPPFR